MNFIYPQNRPDLYFRLLSELEYNEQLSILTDRPEENYIGFNEDTGFIRFSLAGKIYETVKGFHLAYLHAKIGENHLHSPQGVFHTIAYTEAIDNLEKAAGLNPQAYGQLLFEAYLKAAEAEKSKTFITRDWEKSMLYYSKAFKIAPQNGPYLVDLMDHYLAKDFRQNKALELFSAIHSLPWVEAAPFTARQLDKLALILTNKGENTLSLTCREKVVGLEPANAEYKRRLCELLLSQCKDKQAKTVFYL